MNIQGPSLIRVLDWIEDRLGAYHLYVADHKGSYIRLGLCRSLTGPWHVHPPGSLRLTQSSFLIAPPAVSADELARFEAQYRARGTAISYDVLPEITTPHIASPDVHVDAEHRRIVIYFHGLEGGGDQVSRMAISQMRWSYNTLLNKTPEQLPHLHVAAFPGRRQCELWRRSFDYAAGSMYAP